MADTIRGFQPKYVGTLGTTLAADRTGILGRIILPGTFVGTVEFYDAPAITGTLASNFICSQGNPLLRQWDSYEVNATFRNGLVTVATGTPTLTYTLS